MDEMRLFAVAGNPVLGTREPGMLRRAFDAAGMNALCVPLAMRNARETVGMIRQLDIRGTVITTPFREEIVPFLDELDGKARAAGAVTIVVNDRGRLIGFNTDPAYRANDTERAGGKETADAQLTDNRRLLAGSAEAFRLFTGREAPLEEMEKALHGGGSPAPDSICVVGFMGAGKSTVGPAVAARLSMPHVDVDIRIEERTGRTITEIFRESGEEVFRRHEKNEIRDILGRGRCVVAAGGGTVLDGENVSRMKGSSLVVWLFAGLEETLLRIGTNPSRPLATGKESIEHTFRNRIPVYARASHLLVKTDGASVDEVAERIVYESDSAFGG
jgi:shikimate kinase